ncbi:hypothetical protein SLE2022_381450 [Rubroshorea leprosula]
MLPPLSRSPEKQTTVMHLPEDHTTSSNTTFVQADPSNFRTIVQKLTGARDDPSAAQKFPITHPTRGIPEMGPKKPAFKLQERRRSAKKLEIKLFNGDIGKNAEFPELFLVKQRGFMVSPVSPLEFWQRVSPTSGGGSESSTSPVEEEEKAIANKGFYLHPSPKSAPRGAEQPELLHLFPLHSPRDGEDDEQN